MSRFRAADYKEISIHLLAWLAYIAFQVVSFGETQYTYTDYLWITLYELPAQLAFTYLTLYWLIPHYLQKRRYLPFTAWIGLLLVFSGFLHRAGFHFLYLYQFRPKQFASEQPWTVGPMLRSTFYLITTSGLIIAFHSMRYGHRQQQLNQQLLNARLTAELKSLKDQINPHFLFNTLNNLYGLTLKDPEKASEMVMRLSQLMHYMLYEGNQIRVPLQKEIEYLQNYLALEKIRYGNDLQLSFQTHGDTGTCVIAPLLLLPFVENAFKHGLSRQLKECWLQINLAVNGGELVLKVENSKPKQLTGKGLSSGATQGIGLQNVSKRLQLLYPERHRLRLMDGEDTYLVSLTLAWKDIPQTKAETNEN
jgi:hypothetical protein